MLTQPQGLLLVRLARQTIEEHLNIQIKDPIRLNDCTDPVLQEKYGVFVTLHKRSALRGCIGSLKGVETIVEGVKRHAVNAAFHDHRFDPVRKDEVVSLQIEVSVLSVPEDLQYNSGEEIPALLRPGTDGVIIQAPGGRTATFLPQVWKQLPDPTSFLDQLCRKAGLPQHAWEKGQLRVQTYSVQYFEEPCI